MFYHFILFYNNVSSPSNGFQETCHPVNLKDASHRVSHLQVVLINYDPWCSVAYINPCQSTSYFAIYHKSICLCCHQISAAVDTLAGELSCKRGRNESFPEDKFKDLEQNLRQIVESTLKVFFDLVYKLLFFSFSYTYTCNMYFVSKLKKENCQNSKINSNYKMTKAGAWSNECGVQRPIL